VEQSQDIASLALTYPYLDQFLKTICQDIEASIERCGSYNLHCGHDGIGRFLHTTIKVDRMPDRSYLLSLTADYVGQEIESGLAVALGSTQSLWWSQVDLTFAVIDERTFAIDFAPIADKLAVFGDRELSGASVARAIAEGSKIDYDTLLLRGDSIVVTSATDRTPSIRLQINPKSVGNVYEHSLIANGSVVHGVLKNTWDDTPKPIPPVVQIILDGQYTKGERPWQIYPVLDRHMKDVIRQQTATIAAAFSS
jgi:hypothetical protein